MSAALYPVLEAPEIEIASTVDGKALAQALDLLDGIALNVGVIPLTAFISAGGEDDYGILEEAEIEVPAENWWSAEDGLTTVRALLEEIRQTDQGDDGLLMDLRGLEDVLAQAHRKQVRWHLAIDL
jgi:hypothetical protein